MINREGKIYLAINEIMKKLPAIPKDKALTINGKKVYNFRGIDDIYAALQPLLVEFKVTSVPCAKLIHSEQVETKNGHTNRVILEVSYDFYAEDGSSVHSKVVSEGMDTGDKACNKAMSAAHKYALLQVFCIPTEEPKDSEIEHHEIKKNALAPSRPPAPISGQANKSPSNLKTSSPNTGAKSLPEAPKESVDQQLARLKNTFKGPPGPKMPVPYADEEPWPDAP